jgi:ketosteroid isomerase-like protein
MKKAKQFGLLMMLVCTWLTIPLLAQNLDKEMIALTKRYEKAYNKKDVKTLVSMYTSDAVRSYSDGRMNEGSAEIQEAMTQEFSANTVELSLQHGSAEMNADGTATAKGTYSINGTAGTGEAIVGSGSYTNTLKKVGSEWLLAKSVIVAN